MLLASCAWDADGEIDEEDEEEHNNTKKRQRLLLAATLRRRANKMLPPNGLESRTTKSEFFWVYFGVFLALGFGGAERPKNSYN